jgi:hypothetical protein
MPKQDLPEVTALARSLLRKYPDRMQVLTEFCEKTGLSVSEAEALVSRVAAEGYAEPTQPRAANGNPNRTFLIIMVVLSLVMVAGLAGLALLLMSR